MQIRMNKYNIRIIYITIFVLKIRIYIVRLYMVHHSSSTPQHFAHFAGLNPKLIYTDPSPHAASLLAGVVALALGACHTCALLTGGSVDCLGCNAEGELGSGDANNRYTPTGVPGLGAGYPRRQTAVCV